MKYKFYVQMDGSTFGPYTAKEILGLDLLDDILVTEESMNGQWLPAKDFDFHDMYLKESGTIINDDGTISRRDSPEITIDDGSSINRLSEHSDSTHTPTARELSKWNWGAFMFNWLWAICNGLYWPLILIILNFIPYVGPIVSFGICVYLGINGTKLAWDAKEWSSWNDFKETQHNWAIAILWIYGIAILICILALIFAN